MHECKQRNKYTAIGALALLMWSFMALFTVNISRIPTFEVMSIALGISFFSTLAWIAYKKRWHVLKQPPKIWLLGLMGIFLNDAAYITAFKFAPAVQVDLINYLWPIMIVLLNGLMTKKVHSHHLLGAVIGFLGSGCLVVTSVIADGFDKAYLFGYAMALLAALFWSFYVVLLKQANKKLPAEVIGLFCGLAAICSVTLHGYTEVFVAPNNFELANIILIGLTTSGSAYYLWHVGISKGHFAILNVLSYSIPVASVSLLVLAHKAEASPMLALAAVLVGAGALTAGRPKNLTRLFASKITRALDANKIWQGNAQGGPDAETAKTPVGQKATVS